MRIFTVLPLVHADHLCTATNSQVLLSDDKHVYHTRRSGPASDCLGGCDVPEHDRREEIHPQCSARLWYVIFLTLDSEPQN